MTLTLPERTLPERSVARAVELDPNEVDLTALDETALDGTELAVDALVVEAVDLDAFDPRLDPAPDHAPDNEPRRHLRVAPDSVRRRRHVRIAAAAAAVSISATLFAVVGFNVELAQHQIQLQALQRQLQTEQSRYYNLRTEVAKSSSPAQIVSLAERLGLVQASTTYLSIAIDPPPADPTGTAYVLSHSTSETKGSLEPVQ